MASFVSVYLSGNQSITGGTPEVVEFDTEVADVDGEFNTSTHRFTATVAGKYLVTFHVHFQVNVAADDLRSTVYKNTTAVLRVEHVPDNTEDASITGSIVLDLSVDDYIELQAENDDNNDTLDGGFRYETNMTITRVQ